MLKAIHSHKKNCRGEGRALRLAGVAKMVRMDGEDFSY